jgi:hypothetical protein
MIVSYRMQVSVLPISVTYWVVVIHKHYVVHLIVTVVDYRVKLLLINVSLLMLMQYLIAYMVGGFTPLLMQMVGHDCVQQIDLLIKRICDAIDCTLDGRSLTVADRLVCITPLPVFVIISSDRITC